MEKINTQRPKTIKSIPKKIKLKKSKLKNEVIKSKLKGIENLKIEIEKNRKLKNQN